MATKNEPQQSHEFQTLILDREFRVQKSHGELFFNKGFITNVKIGDPLETMLLKFWNKDVANKALLVLEDGKTFSKIKTINPRAHYPLSILISLEPLVVKDKIEGIVFGGVAITTS